MLSNCVAILNVDSSNISLYVGERSVNGTFTFRSKESVDYYAFYDGEFSDVKEFKSVVEKLYSTLIENNAISSISSIYVSLPGEFTKTLSKNYKITFNKSKKITLSDVESLYNLGYENVENYTLVNRSEIYFVLNNVKTHNPIGFTSNTLAGRLCYVYAQDYYKNFIDEVLTGIGIKDIKYISVDLAQNRYLFNDDNKDVCRILADVGYVTTSVSISSGNGLLFNGAVSLGGGIITAYLSNNLECDYDIAEKLKGKINLGLRDNENASYVISDRFLDEFSYSRNEVNDITKSVLDELAESIDKKLSTCTLKIPSDVEIYFTGNGICSIRGAVEYVASRLNSYPNVIAPKIPHYDKPSKSSQIALLDTAITYKNDKIFFA